LAAKRRKTTLVTFTQLSSAHTVHESTGVATGGTGGTCLLDLNYSVTDKECQKCTKKLHFHTTKYIFFLGGRDTATSPNLFPVGRRHPSSYLTVPMPPLQLDPSYATARIVLLQSSKTLHESSHNRNGILHYWLI